MHNDDNNDSGFYHWRGDDLILNVLGHGGAKKMLIGKVRGNQLKVSVTAAAEKGRATQQMIRFLAKEFAVKSQDIQLLFGATSKNKQFLIRRPQKLPAVIKNQQEKNRS